MIANASAGGTLLSDGIGWGNTLDAKRVKMLVLVVLGFGVLVTLAFGGASPIQLIIVAQALTVIFAPVLGILLMILANNASLMGEMKNAWWQNLVGVLGLLAIFATCYRLVIGLLGGAG